MPFGKRTGPRSDAKMLEFFLLAIKKPLLLAFVNILQSERVREPAIVQEFSRRYLIKLVYCSLSDTVLEPVTGQPKSRSGYVQDDIN